MHRKFYVFLFPIFVLLGCGSEKLANIKIEALGNELSSDSGFFSFGLVPTNTNLGAIEFTITNTSEGSLNLNALSAVNNSPHFQITGPTATKLEPNQSTTFSVAFVPTVSGSQSETLTVNSDAANIPSFSIALRGSTEWGNSFLEGSPSTLNKSTTLSAEWVSTCEFNSKLYAIWAEASSSSGALQIRAAVFNGNVSSPSWSLVDGAGTTGINKDTSLDATRPRLVAFDSKLYATWVETGPTGKGSQIRVAVYNGNDDSPSWSFVDGNGSTGINRDSNEDAFSPFLISFANKLYAFWSEEGSPAKQIRFAVYNGNDSSPAWSLLDGGGGTGLNKNTNEDANHPFATVFNDKLYLCWFEYASSSDNHAHIAVYNGNDSSPTWTDVDGNLSRRSEKPLDFRETRFDIHPILASHKSKLYLAYSGLSNGKQKVRIAQYNSTDSAPSWTRLDNGGLSKNGNHESFQPYLLSYRNKLYLSWLENRGAFRDVRMTVFNEDSSWLFVDGGGTTGINASSQSNASSVHLVSFSDRLMASWAESNGTNAKTRLGIANP